MSAPVPQYETELAEVRSMLATDGFDLEVVAQDPDGLHLRLVNASPEACDDCIVPKPVMMQLIANQLEGVPVSVGRLTYPNDESGREPSAARN